MGTVAAPRRRWSTVLATSAWYLLVALPLRPPWSRAPRTRHSRARRAMARVLVCGAVALQVSGGPALPPASLLQAVMTLRTLPVSAAAAVWGLAHRGRLGLREGMLTVTGMAGGDGPRGALTVGSTVLTHQSRNAVTETLFQHERRHGEQWGVLGPGAFPLAYAVAEVVGDAWLGPHGRGNVFEIEAGLPQGGYHPGRPSRLAGLLDHWLAPALVVEVVCRAPWRPAPRRRGSAGRLAVGSVARGPWGQPGAAADTTSDLPPGERRRDAGGPSGARPPGHRTSVTA